MNKQLLGLPVGRFFDVARVRKIFTMATPIAVALCSGFIMIFVDLAMVGVLGNNAVAAIGFGGFTHTLVLATIVGVAPAVQGIVARREGEESGEARCLPLNGGLLLVLLVGLPISVISYWLTPAFFSILSDDPAIRQEGIPYLQALFVAVIALGMTDAFEGFWTGIARVKVYMVINLVTNALNIFLNWVLIFGNLGAPALGTLGAGMASAIAMYTSVVLFFVVTAYRFWHQGFLQILPSKSLLKKIVQVGLPASAQSFFYSAGIVVYFWMVGKIGAAELAVTNIIVRITLFLAVFSMALGMSAATLASNSLGRGDAADADAWGRETVKVGFLLFTLLGLPLVFFPEGFISIFLHDAETIQLAIVPTQISGLLVGIGSLIYIFSHTLTSLGDGGRVFVVSIGLHWAFFLPAVWVVGPMLDYGLVAIWAIHAAYGVFAAIFLTYFWFDGRWKNIEL